MASMNIREAAALHQDALELRSFLHEQEKRLLQWSGDEEPRSPSPTSSLSTRSGGVVLFDPSDVAQDSDGDAYTHHKRRPFRLQLEPYSSSSLNNQDEPEEEDHDNEEEATASDNNQLTHDDNATQRLRDRAIDEICRTEQSYVAAIRALHDFYIVPLEDNKHPIMEDAQIAVFFNNLRQLVMLNSKLRNDLVDIVDKRRHGILVPLASPVYLKQQHRPSSGGSSRSGNTSTASSPNRPQDEPPTEGIGAVFCRYAPLFKLYGGYAKDYEQVAQLLQSYKRDSRLGFAQFLQTCQARSGSDESFESLLIKPIQRIPRYKLLLERICEYTSPGHRDELFLREAVTRVAVAASLINETVRDQENLESVLEAQKKFAGQLSLVTAERRLLRSGKLTKLSTKRREEVMLHLFNDILVYSGVLLTGGYRVRRVVQLTSKAVGVRLQIPASHRAHVRQDCGFVVTSLEKTFVLFASSPEERISWVRDITAAIDGAQQKMCATSETPADAAALWVPDAVAGACTVCHAGFKVFFRRHHCRRCGAVVCGNCSARRSILFVGDSCREERVCTPCYKVLRLVKLAAFKWLSLAVEFKGVLRRKRWNKWSEHYFELKAGILKQYTLASASGMHAKCCTDTLDLTGAIVIHRADERSLKNRFCFQISTAESSTEHASSSSSNHSSPQSGRGSRKLSPLKHWRESATTSLSSEGSFGSLAKASHQQDQLGWILCATAYSEEMDWSGAVQRSADRALLRARRSRVTECAFPVPFERLASLPSTSSLLGGISELEEATDEASKLEHRRYQILKEIVRAEESYITCLGECLRVFVQPLLLRQLEAQQRLRRKQSKRKKSFLHALGGSSSTALHAAASLAQRTVSSHHLPLSLSSSMRVLSSSSGRRRGESHSVTSSKPLVLDADMAIFFSSIDQLCTLNQQLLEHLSRHVDEIRAHTSSVERVFRPGAIFSAYAPLFQLYTSYASRHEAALTTIASPQFAGFLKEIPEDASVHRLRTYLNLPMERIPRYKLFLHELLECTPPDHIDFAPLQAALKSVNQVANKVQEIIARRESARRLDEISARVGLDLRGRRFVMDGALKKVCRSKVQQYYFVLLEDALVYGRTASGLHKKKFRLIELAECKVSDDTERIPRAVNAVTGGSATSNNAFYFFSPLKSFILVAASEAAKLQWMRGLQESIDKTLRGGPRSSARRASIRSELLVDEDELAEDELESGAIVIKNGWLNAATPEHAAARRLWITLSMHSLSLSALFKSAQLEETLDVAQCEAAPMKEPTFFRVYVHTHSRSQHAVDRRAYTFETQSPAEREEWVRALHHCISGSGGGGGGGGGVLLPQEELRRRSFSGVAATHAPILLFNKVSSVCMICFQSFAVYRPRHHCRLCGSLVCGHCSKRKWTLTYGATKKASRICDGCAEAATGSASSLVSEL